MALSGRPYIFDEGQRFNQFCPITYSTLMAAGAEETLTVPVLTSPSSNLATSAPFAPQILAVITIGTPVSVMVRNNATAVFPTAAFAQEGGELATFEQPLCKLVKGGDVLHFITDTADTPVNVAFYLYN